MAVLGRNFLISINEIVVAGQKNGSITFTMDNTETTVKGDGDRSLPIAKTYEPNEYNWEVHLDGAYILEWEDPNYGYGSTNKFPQSLSVGQKVGVVCSIGGETYAGTGYISGFTANGDMGDITTYDVTIQGSGALGSYIYYG